MKNSLRRCGVARKYWVSRDGAKAQRQKNALIDENLLKHHVLALRRGMKKLGPTQRRYGATMKNYDE